MEKQIITVNPKEFGLDETKALELTSGLNLFYQEREMLKNTFIDVISLDVTEENLATFKELRLKFVKNRTQGFEKWHKVNKEFFLTGGRFVDAIKNKEVAENSSYENQLAEKEKFFENLEKQRLAALKKERETIIAPFGYDFSNVDLSAMDESMFEMILTGAKKTHEDRIIAEKKAEAERIEAARLEAERLEAQRLENERLKKEAEIKEAELKKEREESAKREAEIRAKAEAELAEQIRLADIEANKQAEMLAKQKAEADKLAAELKSKEEAEAKLKAEQLAKEEAEKAAAKKAALAPDKDKLTAWIESITLTEIEVKSTESNAVKEVIEQKFLAFKKWASEQVLNIK